MTQLLITFLIISVAMLFVIFFISLYFAKRAIEPIKVAFYKQKQFVADASHELKTPLSVINANTDALLANKTETVESQSKWIEYINGETARMSRLIGDMLDLAKSDEQNNRCHSDLPVDVSVLTENTIALLEAVIYEKGLTLEQRITPDIILSCDGERLAQVMLILLDNAVKYTTPNGKIIVILERAKHCISISVKNTATPVSEDELDKLFDRFYRADMSREHNGGYGLGLAIAKTTVENIGGKIFAEYLDGEMVFSVQLRSAKG